MFIEFILALCTPMFAGQFEILLRVHFHVIAGRVGVGDLMPASIMSWRDG